MFMTDRIAAQAQKVSAGMIMFLGEMPRTISGVLSRDGIQVEFQGGIVFFENLQKVLRTASSATDKALYILYVASGQKVAKMDGWRAFAGY